MISGTYFILVSVFLGILISGLFWILILHTICYYRLRKIMVEQETDSVPEISDEELEMEAIIEPETNLIKVLNIVETVYLKNSGDP